MTELVSYPKYKPGDKVKVKFLAEGTPYTGFGIDPSFINRDRCGSFRYCDVKPGDVVTIKKECFGKNPNFYTIEESNLYKWSDDFFEPVTNDMSTIQILF